MRKALSLSLAVLVLCGGFFHSAGAATTDTEKNKITIELPLPPLIGTSISSDGNLLGVYIRTIFIYFIWIVGLLAVVMVIWGGVQWIMAAGNPTRISAAREHVTNAIIGVVIALTSVVLLNTINPNLTNFASLQTTKVTPEELAWSNEVLSGVESVSSCGTNLESTGEPSFVYSGKHATKNPTSGVEFGKLDLNVLITRAVSKSVTFAKDGKSVTPEFVKAIFLVESPKIVVEGKTQLYSGLNGEGSAAYGIGQFRIQTLLTLLPQVNGGLPTECNKTNVYNESRTNYSQQCKDWLDKRTAGFAGAGMSGLQAQVSMTTIYLQQFLNDSCINGNMELAAAAYNQGLGGAKDSFCGTAYQKDPVKRQAVKEAAQKYIRDFQSAYSTICRSAQ